MRPERIILCTFHTFHKFTVNDRKNVRSSSLVITKIDIDWNCDAGSDSHSPAAAADAASRSHAVVVDAAAELSVDIAFVEIHSDTLIEAVAVEQAVDCWAWEASGESLGGQEGAALSDCCSLSLQKRMHCELEAPDLHSITKMRDD